MGWYKMRELEKIKQELRDITNRITVIQKRLNKEGYAITHPRRTVLDIITALSRINDEVEIERIYESCEKEGINRDITDKNIEGLRRVGKIFEPKKGYIKTLN